jgi:hypothetical protein
LIEKGQEAINGIMELLEKVEGLEHMKSLGNGLKVWAMSPDKLIDLQRKLKDVEDETVKTTNNVTNNASLRRIHFRALKLLKQGFLK